MSSLLELDKTRPDPEFYIGLRDISREVGSSVEVSNLLQLDKLGRDSVLQSVKLKIKPPQNEKIVFKIDRTRLIEEVFANSCQKPLLETNDPKRVVVEFSSPNIAKPFHVGHLRSTIIGNFISNLNVFLGHQVTRLNYLGDWGTQFGYLNLGVELKQFSDEAIQRSPIERLYEAYVAANAAGEKDPKIHEQAKAIFRDLENGSFKDLARWEQYRRYTVDELTSLYERINVRYDDYHWESMYGRDAIEGIISEMVASGVLQSESDSRLVATVAGGQVPVIKSDGTTLYLTRDIAAFKDRFERYGFDEMLYIVENGQNNHFTALFSIVEQMKLPCSGRGKHIKFGRIKGMSTRKGTVVFLRDILDEARDIMREKQALSKSKICIFPLKVSYLTRLPYPSSNQNRHFKRQRGIHRHPWHHSCDHQRSEAATAEPIRLQLGSCTAGGRRFRRTAAVHALSPLQLRGKLGSSCCVRSRPDRFHGARSSHLDHRAGQIPRSHFKGL